MDNRKRDLLQCPMCSFTEHDNYALTLHVETRHFANESPFVSNEQPIIQDANIEQDSDSESSKDWITCPEKDCQEQVAKIHFDDHMDFHIASTICLEDDARMAADIQAAEVNAFQQERSGLTRTSTAFDKKSSKGRVKVTVDEKQYRRLGKKELGPFAYEKHMPLWLHTQLLKGAKQVTHQKISQNGQLYRESTAENEARGIVPLIATLLEEDANVAQAYLCHPSVRHIFKTPTEGSFCGYRNIQMLASFMLESQWPRWQKLCRTYFKPKENKDEEGIPNVLDIQDQIESAWDRGYHSAGRVETGGIWDTRKFIGTPEIEALLDSHKIPFQMHGFTDCNDNATGDKYYAHQQLLDSIHEHFSQQSVVESPAIQTAKVRLTNAPPLYFQQPGHSLTAIGVETRKDGKRSLLVLDPAHGSSPAVRRMLETNYATSHRIGSSTGQAIAGRSSKSTSSPSQSPKGKSKGSAASSVVERTAEAKSRKAQQLLAAYRREEGRLKKHREFEYFKLVPS